MITNQIGWCGKLPNHGDFIQSHTDSAIEAIFIDWIINGQGHIGESLFRRKNIIHYFYMFGMNSLFNQTKSKIYGTLFISSDSTGRTCPFIFYTKNLDFFFNNFFKSLEGVFDQLNFDLTKLNERFEFKEIMDSFDHMLEKDFKKMTLESSDCWLQYYPRSDSLILKTQKTTPIVYRKLMLR